MTAKEYLSQVRKMDRRIKILQSKAEKLRSMLDYRSPSFDTNGGSSSADRLPDTLAKIMEYESRAEELRAKCIDKFIEIDSAIRSIQNVTQREVLERRYLFYQRWEQIAEEMHYSERHILRLHGEALQQINVIECHP